MTIENGYPLFEPVLRKDLVAQVPLAHVSGAVVGIADHFGQATKMRFQSDTVVRATICVGPGSRQEGRSRWRANRVRYAGLLKYKRLRSKLVEIRRQDLVTAITRDRVSSLLIRKKDEQIRFARKCRGLRPDSGSERNPGRTEGGSAQK